MTIRIHANIHLLDQNEFGRIAYGVMEHIFEVHNNMGRFLDEGAELPFFEDHARHMVNLEFVDYLSIHSGNNRADSSSGLGPLCHQYQTGRDAFCLPQKDRPTYL